MTPELIARFVEIVGPHYAVTDPLLCSSYLKEPRGLYGGRSSLVLLPENPEQIAKIMILAQETHTCIVPQGGNTGLVGGQQPDQSGNQVIVSLKRLNQIRSMNIQDRIAVVESGVILNNLQKKATEFGCFFPLSLASGGSAQIGGILSSNAGGIAVLAYGNARELCLGLEVVLPDGRILDDLRYVKKDNSGYDLKDLFIGAEGTLGIITAATMKLFPKPLGKSLALIGVQTVKAAQNFLYEAQNHAGTMLTAFELISASALEISLAFNECVTAPLSQSYPWYILVEISSLMSCQDAERIMTTLLSSALEQSIIKDAVMAKNGRQETLFWQLRETISPAQNCFGGSIKHDISVPVSVIPDFLEQANAIIAKKLPNASLIIFGHMGDGNLHYNIGKDVDQNLQSFLAQRSEIYYDIHQLAVNYGGSFSAEHGIGQIKCADLLAFKSPVALDLMRHIKTVFDPLHLMNPGKILPSSVFSNRIEEVS